MEFASIFNGLGVAVTVLHRGDQVLRDFDMDLRDGLAEAMRNRGIDLRMGTDVAAIEKEGQGYRVHLEQGGVHRRRSGDGGDRPGAEHVRLRAWET